MLNIADIIALSGIALALFLVILVLQKKEKIQADKLLISWLLIMALHFAYFYINFHRFFDNHIIIQTLGSSLPVFHAPLIYLYVRSLAKRTVSLQHIVIFLSPVILYLLGYFYLFESGYFKAEGFIKLIMPETPVWVFALGPLMIFLNIIYIIALVKVLHTQQRYLKSNFSYENKITLKWVQYWVVSFIISAFLISFAIVFSDLGKISNTLAFIITSISMLIQLLIIAQFGLQQTTAFINHNYYKVMEQTFIKEIDSTNVTITKYAKSGLQPIQGQELINKLSVLMDNKKPYLNENLTLPQLANLLDIPAYQLSQAINEGLQLNFFDFVNQYRIKLVQKLLKDPAFDQYTILGIALDAGFNSKSTFNKAFKKYTGTTPSAYRKKA